MSQQIFAQNSDSTTHIHRIQFDVGYGSPTGEFNTRDFFESWETYQNSKQIRLGYAFEATRNFRFNLNVGYYEVLLEGASINAFPSAAPDALKGSQWDITNNYIQLSAEPEFIFHFNKFRLKVGGGLSYQRPMKYDYNLTLHYNDGSTFFRNTNRRLDNNDLFLNYLGGVGFEYDILSNWGVKLDLRYVANGLNTPQYYVDDKIREYFASFGGFWKF